MIADMLTHLASARAPDTLLTKARDAGVTHLVVACTLPSGFVARKECEMQTHLAAGIHPSYVQPDTLDAELAKLSELLAQHPKMLVGEIGLDARKNQPDKKSQERACLEQLKIANAFERPIIVHCVKRSARVLELLAAHAPKTKKNARGYIHGYTGSTEMAQAFIKQGFYISFGTAILNAKSKRARACVKALPLDRMLVESDAPSMPLPSQKEGEPQNVLKVLKEIAKLKQKPLNEVQEAIAINARVLLS